MNSLPVLRTDHLELVGAPGAIDFASDPPVLFAEETYVVRTQGGYPLPDLAGALVVAPGALEGRLRFGNYVGLAELDGFILRIDSRRMTAPAADRMLDELISVLEGLPSRALPPTGAAFDRPLGRADDLDLLAYLVVRNAMKGQGPHDLSPAIAQILARPHERLVDEQTDRPIWEADRVDGRTLVEMASRPVERVRVPPGSILAGTPIATRLGEVLPARVRVGHYVPTNRTIENRFVATVLDRCTTIVRNVQSYAARESSLAMAPLRDEATQLATKLERWRRHRVLEDLEPLQRLPTTSTVLRGRAGYRDVLRLYADLLGRTNLIPPAAAARIVSLRNVATLYEWWCYFQVVRAVTGTLGDPLLIDPPTSSWQGAELGQGLTAHFAGAIQVEFNRTFSQKASSYRSYSVTLRPDILVETPWGRHVFDAKFAFEPLAPTLDEDDDADDESVAGRARRWHIHKMHTYRDALDRVVSVRVLYPGTISEWFDAGPCDAGAGVGALPLRPGDESQLDALQALLTTLLAEEKTAIAV